MSVDSNRYIYKGSDPFRLIKWKVKCGSQIFPSTVLLTYAHKEEKEERKLRSNVNGVVQTLLVEEGQLVEPGNALLQLQSCTHEVIMKELCAQCGADLRQLSRQNLQEVVATRSFSMVHVVPELRCSLEQAKQLDEADETRLLKARKLILLVDLDQTLIHTTNENVPTDMKDVHHFQLYGPKSPWYHTRLRPQTLLFLERISHYYEMHIFTFGARMYAHKIASILDPDGKLFSHRILSRDECFDSTSKTGNLKSLFPRGDNMVCIIDDREDVWNFAPNVVHVKPYVYFCNTGDINAPPNARHKIPNKDSFQQIAEESTADSFTSVEDNSAKDCDVKDGEISATENVGAATLDQSLTEPRENPSNSNDNANGDAEISSYDDTSIKDSPVGVVDSVEASEEKCDDDDDYLLYLEEILVSIHKAYYDIYDETASQKGSTSSPDLKNIIPYVRRKVLQGVNIVFSGVIPTNMDPEKSSLWLLAKSFGANVTTDLVFNGKNNTTHIIASKMGTAKLNKARKNKDIHVVTPSWLICCATRWERVDERLFPLKKGSNLAGLPKKYKKHLRCKELRGKYVPKGAEPAEQSCESMKYSPVLNFSQEELEMMGKEVNDACEEFEESNESGSSEARSERRSYACRKRKRRSSGSFEEANLKNAEQNSSHDNSCEEPMISSSTSTSNSSIASDDDDEDDELAAAVEKNLLNSIPNTSN